jgi:2-polyprenyl-3-methyl-5-hydroxy-6-metoxy-1,4-benzoquinol methylase
MHLTHRKSCRICGSTSLRKVIDLGPQHLQGSFVKPGDDLPPLRRISCVLVRCDPTADENACGLLQMEHSVPPEILYSSYWYRSGTNQTMRDHLSGIAKSALQLVRKPRGAALDIGCNDGTLLKNYPKSWRRIGVDPSDIAQEVKDGIQVVQDVFPSPELNRRFPKLKFDVITSIAMFYDLEDPVTFVRNIQASLAPDGVWIVEMSYMPSMLELNSYDTICHEHLEYYSLSVIENILRRAGLKVFRAELNESNGGSIRCYVTHASSIAHKKEEWLAGLKRLRQSEFDLELDTDKPYKSFQDRINLHRDELVALLKQIKREGKRIHIYGASTKGNTILQWCNLDNRIIDCAAERNPDKYGASTLGTDIPIVSEAESRQMNPDYYLVLPWHFKEEFMRREKVALEKGTGFIFPLPTIDVIKEK